MPRHVKRDDMVEVIAGDDKGKQGRVLRVLPERDKVVVEGVNQIYRHLKPSRKNPQGGRVQKESPIHISNVLPVSPKTGSGTRVGFRATDGGGKERFGKKCGTSLGALRKSKTQE